MPCIELRTFYSVKVLDWKKHAELFGGETCLKLMHISKRKPTNIDASYLEKSDSHGDIY